VAILLATCCIGGMDDQYFSQSKFLFVLFKLCTNKNHSCKHNEQIKSQNIYNSECFGVKLVKECFGVKFVKIYTEMTSQYFFE
jgi:hypothetical protein